MTLSIAWWGERAPFFRACLEPVTIERTVRIPPGARVVVGGAGGAGILGRLWLQVDGWFWKQWDPHLAVDPAGLLGLDLRISWDGEARPSVRAPVAAFFANGQGVWRHYASEYLVSSSAGFQCHFPMPFRRGFRMEIENRAAHGPPVALLAEATYQPLAGLPALLGRFHASHRRGIVGPLRGATVLRARGPGQFVGMTLAIEGEGPRTPEFFATREALVIERGNGSVPQEIAEYFEGYEGRNGEFAGPLRGVPLKDPDRLLLSMYRFHPEDAIRFLGPARFSYHRVREGGVPVRPFRYSSVAFWYRLAAPRVAGGGAVRTLP